MPIETVLLTGATGFVGSHVVEAMVGRALRVRALIRKTSRRDHLEQHGVEPVVADLDDVESVVRAVDGADVVVHMAAVLRGGSAEEFQRVNAAGTTTIVEAIKRAKRRPRRLVYLSSLAAVGPARNGKPVSAIDEPMPLTAYGRSKLAGEQISRGVEPETEVVILRAPAVYGPGDRDVFEFFRLASWGVIPVPTGPPRPLQMIHVSDLARALALAATADVLSGVYHIAEQQAYPWEEVGRLVGIAVGRNARPLRIPAGIIEVAGALSEAASNLIGKPAIFTRDKARELLAPGWLCETEAARAAFGFEAQKRLPQGLAETAKWYRAQGWL